MSKIYILLGVILLSLIIAFTYFQQSPKDECDVNKDIVPQSEISEYLCEENSKCEWKLLGGVIESHYSCCPKNLYDIEDGAIKYPRCYTKVD